MTIVVQAARPAWSAMVCLAVLDAEWQVKRLGSCPGQLVWPTAFQEHIGRGPCLGQRGETGAG